MSNVKKKGEFAVVRNSLNALPDKGSVNEGEDMTVPDQAMSIPEILRKYANGGLPNHMIREGVYDEEGEGAIFPDFEKLNAAEREEVMELAREELNTLRDKIKAFEIQRDREINPNPKKLPAGGAEEELPEVPKNLGRGSSKSLKASEEDLEDEQ